jgi:hypothetical protein
MKAASLKEIKTELSLLHPRKMQEVCLRLAKYKKENKELLTYLLFEEHDENAYVKSIQSEINELFNDVNKTQSYLTKKTIRKILRIANKYIRYSGSKQTEVEIRIFFCKKFKSLRIPLQVNSVLGNLYFRQLQKIDTVVSTLHEDLQFDYSEEIKALHDIIP